MFDLPDFSGPDAIPPRDSIKGFGPCAAHGNKISQRKSIKLRPAGASE
jgi:hypothetical protein